MFSGLVLEGRLRTGSLVPNLRAGPHPKEGPVAPGAPQRADLAAEARHPEADHVAVKGQSVVEHPCIVLSEVSIL